MEPLVAATKIGDTCAPLAVWTTDSPSTPKTIANSPVVLQRTASADSAKTFPSNNNEPNGEGVKFLVDGDDSICSSGSSDTEEKPQKGVPDGGWGWVVVCCSLVISMIADGISFSFGLMFVEFLDAFGESKAKTAWIGSLFMAVPLLTGPIMSAFVDRYGCRLMTIVGGIISAFGFVLACLGNSVEYEYVTFGFIAGLGLGLCYVTAVVSVCLWFDKHRALATGLGACGTGFGTFVYAPMTQYFIDQFGWRGTVLLLGGTFLNMCVCGALLRDPEYVIESKAAADAAKSRNPSSCGSISGTDSQFPGTEEIRNMMKAGKKPEDILCTLAETFRNTESVVNKKEGLDPPRPCHSLVDLPTHLRNNVPLSNIVEESAPGLISCRSASDQGNLNQQESPTARTISIKRAKKKQMSIDKQDLQGPQGEPLLTPSSPTSPTIVVANGLTRPRQRMSIFKRQMSLRDGPISHYQNLRVHRNSMMYRGATLTSGRYHLRASSCPNIYRNSMTTLAKEGEDKWYSELVELARTIFDFSMFLELHFFFLSVAIILLFSFFIVPYFYLPEMMMRKNYTTDDGSQLLSWCGLVNAFGMILFGYIGDLPWVNVSKLFAVCMLACGLSCIAMPLVVEYYWVLAVSVWAFGFFFASSYSLTPPLIVELIPMERFSTAYGLILLCQGIGNFLGPPLAGGLFDITGIWDYSFYLAGGGVIVCGLLIGLIPITTNKILFGKGILEMDRVSMA